MIYIYIIIDNQLVGQKLKESLDTLLLGKITTFTIIVTAKLPENIDINNIFIIEENILKQTNFKNNYHPNSIIITENLYISDDISFNNFRIAYKPLSIKHLEDQLLSIIQKNKPPIILHNVALKIDVNKAHLYNKNIPETICELSNIEATIMSILFENYPNSLSKEFILKKIWGFDNKIETKTLEAHIYNIRGKLQSNTINLAIDKLKDGFILKFL